MNYIDELNSFYDWVTFNQISLDAQGLWNLLMQMNNKHAVKINNIWYWPVEFSIPNSKILLMTGCSQQQLIRSRNALIKSKRITYKKGRGNQSGKYTIIPFDNSLKDCYIDNSSVRVWAYAEQQDDKQSGNKLINKTETVYNQNENGVETICKQSENEPETNYNQSKNEAETNPSFYLLNIKDKTNNKTKNNILHGADESASAPERDAVFSLILNDKSYFGITQESIDHWQELYPAVDIIAEIRKMQGWLEANPKQRKTKKGIMRFINSWLSREQDKGGLKNGGRNSNENTIGNTDGNTEKTWDEMFRNAGGVTYL